MSELKPCFCEPCAACFGNGHAFNDLVGRSTRCSICAGTGRVSRAARKTRRGGIMSHAIAAFLGAFVMLMVVVTLTQPSDWCIDHSTPTMEGTR